MNGERKPFSQELYDDDDSAKEQLIAYLAAKGFDNPRVNPDQYGIDVLAERGGEMYAFEVEVKHNWKGGYFPYKEVHFAYRKIKFTEIPDISLRKTFFVMLNHERNIALRVDGVTFAASPVTMKKTKYTSSEKFVEVPVHLVSFFQL